VHDADEGDEGLDVVNVDDEEDETGQHEKEDEDIEPCSVCQTRTGPWKKSSRCGHVLCASCWDAWLLRRIECPLCRAKCRVKYLEPSSPVRRHE
jgi:hypothetical protein